MKNIAVFYLVFASLCGAALAEESAISPLGVARSASLFLYVGAICPKFFKIDVDLAGRYFKAEGDVGAKAFGASAFSSVLLDELLRRGKEVDSTGNQKWCAAQKSNLESLGMTAIYR